MFKEHYQQYVPTNQYQQDAARYYSKLTWLSWNSSTKSAAQRCNPMASSTLTLQLNVEKQSMRLVGST